MTKKISTRRWFIAALLVAITIIATNIVFAESETGEEASAHFGLLSLATPFLAIVLSFITKQVVLSLATAIFVGAIILDGGNVFTAFLRTCDTYIVGTVTDSWNATLLVFILAVGGLIAIMSKMGGMQAMAIAMSKKAKNAKNSLLITWIMGLIIFFEDYANSLVVGPTMRPATDRERISREKLSYVIDSTAGPVTDLAPISSWTAYEIGMIAIAFSSVGYDGNAYGTFIQTLPYRFYNIFAIFMVLIVILMQRDYGPMYRAEKRARLQGKLYEDNAKPMMSKELDAMNVKEGAPLRMCNAVVPIVVFTVVTILALWYTGGGVDEPFNFTGIQNALGNADAATSILYSVIFTSILSIIMAVAQRIMSLKECIGIFVETELAHRTPQELSPLDQLIQYIARPVYERVPGNDNVKTFDRIRITVGLPRYQFNSWEALQNEVKKSQYEIYQRVIQRLETDRPFKRYGVPINFLEISNVTLLRDFSLEFIFELKEPKIN